MKLVSRSVFSHQLLKSALTGEEYSLSYLVSNYFGTKQLFIHHDIIVPLARSSAPHRHTIIEEVVYVSKGSVVVVFDGHETTITEGTFIFFDPKDLHTHYVLNKTDQEVETITFSMASQFDVVVCKSNEEEPVKIPGYYFDKDLKDIPNDKNEWEIFFSGLKIKLNIETHPEKRLYLLELIGMTARTLTKLDEAESALLKALSISYGHPSHGRLVQNLIHLAHVYQWKKQFEKSQLLFDQAKALMNEKLVSEELIAGYHQYLGKLYFDQSLFAKAQSEFATALSIHEKTQAPKNQTESSRNFLIETLQRWGRKFPEALYIRKAIPKDAEDIHKAHMKSIQEICSKDYSLTEIQGWGHRPYNEGQRLDSIKNDLIWVIEDQGSIEGYGHLKFFEKDDLKRAHVFGLYLTPKVVGKSLGVAMIDVMMEEINAAKIKKVTLEATITALGFYQKLGFIKDGPQINIKRGDVLIRCHPMRMDL